MWEHVDGRVQRSPQASVSSSRGRRPNAEYDTDYGPLQTHRGKREREKFPNSSEKGEDQRSGKERRKGKLYVPGGVAIVE